MRVIRSWSPFFKEWQDRFAHGCSFLKSNEIESLTVTLFKDQQEWKCKDWKIKRGNSQPGLYSPHMGFLSFLLLPFFMLEQRKCHFILSVLNQKDIFFIYSICKNMWSQTKWFNFIESTDFNENNREPWS